MRLSPAASSRGVSLIELLVVIAILGLLAVAVLPNLANTAEARRSREAARMVSSFIAKAQTRAIGRRDWAGFMFTNTGTASLAAIDLVLADVLPPFRGDTTDATIVVSSTPHPDVSTWRSASADPAGALQSGSVAGVRPYDLIRFAGRGPMYEIVSFDSSTLTIRLRGPGRFGEADFTDSNIEDMGQVLANTPWPAPAPLPFEIFRTPQPVGLPLSLEGDRAIDVFWSGYGPPNVGAVTGSYRRFTNPGSRISIVFDGTGRLRQIVEATPTANNRLAVTGAVFLLIGRVDRVPTNPAGPNAPNLPAFNPNDDSTGVNWQYPDSWWIAIDALTGMTKIAECKPNAVSVEDSQQWIREALLASGR